MPRPNYELGYCAADSSRFLPPLWYQAEALYSSQHLTILQMGRGAGKSETVWLNIVKEAIKWPFLNVLFGAPSHKVLTGGIFKTIDAWRRIVEQDPKDDGSGGWGFDPIADFTKSAADMRLTFDWGSQITFRSTKDMDDFRAQSIGMAAFDEADYIDATPNQWAAFVPCMRGYGPNRIVVAGTPSTSGTGLMSLVLEAAKSEPDSVIARATTLDNPFFPEASLRLMRATMTADDWAREVEGRPVSRTGLVYPEFVDENIIDWDYRRELANPLGGWRTFILLDWGYSMAHALFVAARQIDMNKPPEVVIYRDLPFDRADAAWMARECKRHWAQEPLRPTAGICDPEGTISRQIAQPFFLSDGIQLLDENKPAFRRIQNTIGLVRRGLQTMEGTRTLFVTREVANQPCNAPGGRGVVVSFRSYQLSEIGRGSGIYTGKPHDDNKHTHSMDCIRYFYINMGKFGFKWPFRFKEENEARCENLSLRQEGRLA